MVSKYKRLMTTVPIDDLHTPKHLPKLFPKRGDLCEALSSLGDVQAGITAGHVAATRNAQREPHPYWQEQHGAPKGNIVPVTGRTARGRGARRPGGRAAPPLLHYIRLKHLRHVQSPQRDQRSQDLHPVSTERPREAEPPSTLHERATCTTCHAIPLLSRQTHARMGRAPIAPLCVQALFSGIIH